MVGLWQRPIVKIWWRQWVVCDWLMMDRRMVGWVGRVGWVDRQKLWFQGEWLGVVDVAWVGCWRTNGGQVLRMERHGCE